MPSQKSKKQGFNYANLCNRVFHSLYKVGRNDIIVFKGFNNSKKKLPQPDARDYY